MRHEWAFWSGVAALGCAGWLLSNHLWVGLVLLNIGFVLVASTLHSWLRP